MTDNKTPTPTPTPPPTTDYLKKQNVPANSDKKK
jgi:hypothetical protein